MNVLVTGGMGFIGYHLCHEMKANGYNVISCDIKSFDGIQILDTLDYDMVEQVVAKYIPDILIHLAGQANIAQSWANPQLTIQSNVIGSINILEAVKRVTPNTRVLLVGSSDEYGYQETDNNQIMETTTLKPRTPYAISKIAQEQFGRLYYKIFSLNVYMVRLFNIAGPGQAKGYLVSDFASAIAEIEAGKRNSISVGNLDSARDYIHVKDACRAIRLILEKGRAGEVYNVSSGKAFSAKDILEICRKKTKSVIIVNQDLGRLRPSDVPYVCGNHDKLTNQTGWEPKHTIEDIVAETLEYWRKQNKDA